MTINSQDLIDLISSMDPIIRGIIFGRSVLSDSAIMKHVGRGNIVIDPFDRESLSTSSYDVKLGEFYYREEVNRGATDIYNIWSESDVKAVWGEPRQAINAGDWMRRHNVILENIHPHDQIIWIWPGETILCHTQEFIGGTGRTVTTMMKARSTVGRNFIEVCKCAGWGDVGYINRWTMEVTNNSRRRRIPLVVGRRIAQIVFFEVECILSNDYSNSGKYQTSASLEEIKLNWKPEAMLPRMYLDREIEETRNLTP